MWVQVGSGWAGCIWWVNNKSEGGSEHWKQCWKDIYEAEFENGPDQIDTGYKVEDDENVHGISDYGDYFSTHYDDGLFELVPGDEYNETDFVDIF